MNNDMMWHDPNPKQKKVQRDTGTSVWGDPSSQQGVSLLSAVSFFFAWYLVTVNKVQFERSATTEGFV